MKKDRKPLPWTEMTGRARPFEASRDASDEAPDHASSAEAESLLIPETGGVFPAGTVAEGGESPGGPGAAGAGIRDDAEARAADYLDQLQRLKAEFDNYRKRTAKEREDWFLHAQAEIAQALLPVLDDVRRSREHETAQEVAEPAGRQLILNRFEDLLEKLGLEKQGAEPGAEFDPEQHDAVMAEPSAEIPEGKILRVLEPGYLFRGRLLRRSRVCYSTGPAGE